MDMDMNMDYGHGYPWVDPQSELVLLCHNDIAG